MPSLVVSASTRTIVKMKGNRFWSFAMNVVVGDFLCSEAGATSFGKKIGSRSPCGLGSRSVLECAEV